MHRHVGRRERIFYNRIWKGSNNNRDRDTGKGGGGGETELLRICWKRNLASSYREFMGRHLRLIAKSEVASSASLPCTLYVHTMQVDFRNL